MSEKTYAFSEAGLLKLIDLEGGLYNEMYDDDGADVPTIGVGHAITEAEHKSGTIRIGDEDVEWGKGITNEQGMALLKQDAGEAMRLVRDTDDGNFTQRMIDAIGFTTFNVGATQWNKSNSKTQFKLGNYEMGLYEMSDPVQGFVRVTNKETGKKDLNAGLISRQAQTMDYYRGLE